MPTKTHIITMKQLMIWASIDPGAPSPPIPPAALFASLPQKSTVKTLKSKTMIMTTIKAKMGTSLHAMTMALSAEASSTPRFTSAMIAQLRTEMNATAPTVSPWENGGKKKPIAVVSITPKATLPIQMESQ